MKIERPPVEVDINVEDTEEQNDYLDSALVSHVKQSWEAARAAKQDITDRLLKCERQRRGEYDPDRAIDIEATGGSDIYMMITDVKCRAASSWIRDVMMSNQDRPWVLDVPERPEIPPEEEEEIRSFVNIEMEEFIASGQYHPNVESERLKEVYEIVAQKKKEFARDRANKMEKLIEDQMTEGGFQNAFKDFIDDFVTYPCAILKGPTIRKKKGVQWGADYTPIVVNDFVREIERVSPYDIFPSPISDGPDDGYIIERHNLSRTKLEALIGVPGYVKTEIERAVDHYGDKGFHYYEYGDQQKKDLEDKVYSAVYHDPDIEVLEYWGPVNGQMLKDYGLKDKSIEASREYEANIWIVGNYVIKAVLNPDPLGKRPYSTASWEFIPGAFWGVALPELMADVQTMCNASARSLANNMGIASGPQVEAVVDRLADGEDLTNMYPWKIWQTTSDKTGGGQPGVRFFQPGMQAAELLTIYQTFSKQADEVTGIPNYVYGSSKVSGAGRTASGLSMLMDNAAKGIKQALSYTDKVVGDIVERYYIHNMMFHDDPYVKGDYNVVAKGASGLIAREQMNVRRNEFMAATSNPIDMQILGMEGRSYLLKETAKSLGLNVEKFIPSEQQMRFMQEQAQQQQMLMAMQQQAQQQQALPQTVDEAGNPAGGVTDNLMNDRS